MIEGSEGGGRSSDDDKLLVLATDAPTLLADDLRPFVDSPAPGAAFARLYLPLVAHVGSVPQAVPPGQSLRWLVSEMKLRSLPASPEIQARLRGANTPHERALLLARLKR